jgi:arylsulfatase A-like enzyme
MATIMTGLPPRVMGVEKYSPLPSGMQRLAEIAWRQGYRTAAFATNAFLTDWYGFDRGFDFFEHSLVFETLLPAGRSVLARQATHYADIHFEADSAELVVPKAITWLWQRGGGGPFFLWIHLMNPHLPYRWRDVHIDNDEEGPLRGRPPNAEIIPATEYFRGRMYKGIRRIRSGEFVPDEVDREALRTLYAREVQFSDLWVGKLMGELKRLNLYEKSVIVVVADHGEELFDHGGFEHGHSVLPEVTGVPLIIRLPQGRQASGIVQEPVSLLDLLPTICHLLSWPVPDQALGESFWPPAGGQAVTADAAVSGVAATPATPFIIENLLYPPQSAGILSWPWLQVSSEGGKQIAWYDLQQDPQARRAVTAPPIASAIQAAADSIINDWDRRANELRDISAAPGGELPAAIKRKLDALGY